MHLAMNGQGPLRFLSTYVVLLLDPSRHSIFFFFAFLTRLWKEGSTGTIPLDNCKALCKTLAKRFLASADFSKAKCIGGLELEHANKWQQTSYHQGIKSNSRPTPEQLQMTITSDNLLNFYDTLAKISTADDDLATLLITKLNAAIPRLPIDHMHNLWLPFLVYLIPILTANAVTLTTPIYQPLYRSMLTHYIKTYVRKQPAQYASLVRPRVTCPDSFCFDCDDLNAFLSSPKQRVDRFKVNKERRKHIHQLLEYHKIDCTHVSERQGTPYTLVITKTFKQQEQQLREWKERKTFDEKKLRQLGRHRPLTPELRVLLGDAYDRIMGVEDAYVESPRAAAGRAAMARVAAVSAASRNNTSAAAEATRTATATASRPMASATGHVRGVPRAGASGSSSWYNPPPVAGVRRRRSITFGDGEDII